MRGGRIARAAAAALGVALAFGLAGAAEAPEAWSGTLHERNGSGLAGAASLEPAKASEAGAATYVLELALEPAPRLRAFATHLRRGSCEAPGRIVAKAEPELNALAEPAEIRIPAAALEAEGGGMPEALIVEVKEQDGRVVVCGALRRGGGEGSR